MMVQAAVIQIDGAHYRLPVIAEKHLGMDKSWGVFIDLYTRFYQLGIVAFCQREGNLLIWDVGKDQPHVNATLGGKFQGSQQFTVQNEVRGHDVHRVLCLVEHIQIHHFAHIFPAQGGIAKGNHVAGGIGGFCRIRGRGQLRLLLPDVPKLQEQGGKAACRCAFYHDTAILPMTENLLGIDVAVLQVYTAGKGNAPVNDHDLAVVPVVVMGGNEGEYRRKYPAVDTQLFQLLGVVGGQVGKRIHAVVQHPHIHPFFCFSVQRL